ncbi:hypothetical protein OV207_08310 [Corallococcus sp. BB11-1]|uniref:hypothetical protein n=1 Tax=Corallococcus sp. BB11-1 TaxID=2996783 RepID=UPI00226DE22A|nr:hypothetical protein [Corallococcus sp. BB11-1]MCY1031456.1 hypothetical protein [Corallococcus sp. BB11-1]
MRAPLEDPLDLILERDPAGMFTAMDATTRERYRHACQELAVRSRRAPHEVAHEALQLALEHDAHDERGRHVGAWLVAEGRPSLEARLGCRIPWAERASRLVRRHATQAYGGSLFMLLGLALLGVERLLRARGIPVPHRVLLEVTLVPLLLEFLQECLNGVLSRLVAPVAPLPRLEPRRVFSPDTRTLLVTPLLVTSAEDIQTQLRMLEINYLGNVEPELFFALLTDFKDAPEPELPGEQDLLERLERGIQELNARHGHREQPRFFVLHRDRRWNPVAARWMGWERKRGKLDELNRWLLGARDTSFRGPMPGLEGTVRYVITLDADAHLLPGDAARLVATLHHPLNRARFDATGRRVVAGYSLLQPGLDLEPTRAHWLATGGWPLSIIREKKRAQREAPWVLQQRLFGNGDFLGKGIYDVAAFTRCLEGRIPENAVLGHDKIEGMFARVAFVHDIQLFESHPTDFSVSARIWHRWVRGDWQLLPWLLPWVPTQDGRRAPNTLALFERWRLLSALLESLRYPSTLCVLACGWLWLPSRSAPVWTLAVTLWCSRHALLGGLGHLLHGAWRSGSLVSGLRSVLLLVPRLLVGALAQMGCVFLFSGVALDAIFRVLYRLAFNRSRMLDWTTYAQSSRESRSLRTLLTLPEVWGALVLSLGIGGLLAVFNPWALPWAAPVLLAWLPMPLGFVRQERPSSEVSVQVEQIRATARSCWDLYAQRAPEGLPDGEPRAGELSPTDLALGLVAPLGAYHLGYVGLDEMVSRVGRSLEVIEGLERHRGHLLASQTGRGGRRISTTESGVLAAALLVVESGLHAASEVATGEGHLVVLEARAQALREAMDFGWLYDSEAELLHTGYDVEARALEQGHHGLLTSGAMLAGFVALASRQVPLAHWSALTKSDQELRQAGARELGCEELAEHLLPTLFVWFPPATLLAQAAQSALEAGRGRPPDAKQEGAVEPPHSVLALRFQPERVVEELQRVARTGQVEPREQAMALVSAANLTCDDILVRHFHQHWQTAWIEALVYETKDPR